MRTVLAVGIAGFVGALARYAVEGLVSSGDGRSFPWGTLVVDLSGSLVIELLFSVLIEGRFIPRCQRAGRESNPQPSDP
jgi:fluoride exporter